MSRIDLLYNRLVAAFPKLKQCLEITEVQKIFVADYKNDGSFIIGFDEYDQPFIKLDQITTIESDHSKWFVIENVKRVAFLPIDGRRGLIGFGTSQCDFVLFDEKDFCFLEFKLNATSVSENAIGKNRREAAKQLLCTIQEFDIKLDKNYQGLNLEAYICTPLFYPRLNASWQELAEEFLRAKWYPSV